ncbi:alpha/beta hydrolase [Thalassotalea litorea]|uniref:Alpha/beta hydrolase n=1 Tax=Thalassotalea litorea TaxID=2020715 RepID=A0A5R9IQ37_9GAMM|nr:alpha/beta hydrolase [Thalassotalea litorea]TLU67644.1 alpha/beta hydrolase [Thalassotalea litorea]
MTINRKQFYLNKGETNNTFQLAALTIGNPEGQVVLCLHGWLDNAASFTPMMESLQQLNSQLLEQYYFVAIDWAGHGLSSHRSSDAYYYFTDWVDDLYQLIDAQNWQQVILLGHSMGAMVANLFTSAFNERVKSLFLIEGIGLLPLAEHPSVQLRDGILSRQKTRLKSRHQQLETAIQARINVSDLKYPQAKRLTQRSMKQIGEDYQWLSDPRVRNTSVIRYSMPEVAQIIAHIDCPVTVFYGDTGFASVRTGITQWQGVYRQLDSVKLSGGHHVHMEDVDSFIEQLTKYLRT